MKKNLFTKFLALFLSGTMLISVGCKDYDDDINSINNRLDELVTGKVATLEQQVASMQSALTALQSADAALGQRIDALKVDVEKNKTELGKLTTAQTSLRNDIDAIKRDYISSDKLTSQLAATLAGYSTTQKIAETYATLDKLGALGDKTVKQAIDAAQAEAVRLAGVAFESNFQGKFNGALELAMTGDGKIAQALAEYDKKMVTAIGNSIKAGGVVNSYIAEELKKALEPLEKRLSALEGRIQSLIFVPASIAQMEDGITFSSADYLMNGATKVYLGEATGRTADLVFQVTPASLVSKMNTTNVSILTEEAATRAEAPMFEVTKVEVKDAVKGLFVVSVKTDYDYTKAGKTLIIALNVKMNSSAGETMQGIDFASAYIATKASSGQNAAANLVVGIADGEEVIEVDPTANYQTEQLWNDKTAHNFFAGTKLYYKDAEGEYTLATEKWNNVTAQETHAATNASFAAGSGTGVATDYTLEKTSFSIKNSSQKLIGNTITSGEYIFNMKVGAYTHKIAAIKEQVAIVGTNAIYEAETAEAAWNYVIAATTNVYESEVLLKGNLLGEVYNEMKGLSATVTLLDDKGAEVAAPVASLNLPSSPDNASVTDTKKVEVTLTGKLPASGNYTVKAVYTLANKTSVTLNIPLVIEGMPKIDDYTFNATSTYAAGKTEYEALKDFAKKVWKAAWAPKFFASEAAFVAALENDMTNAATADADGKAALKVAEKNINAIYTGAEKGKVYTPSVKFTHKTITDLTVTYKASVGIQFPEAAMSTDAAYNDGKPTVVAGFSAKDTYKTTGLDLSQIYTYTGTVLGVKVMYTVVDEAAEAKSAKVTSDNILDWGTYTERSIAMKAELMLDTYVLETKTFNVTLPDPIKDAAITIDKTKTTLYASKTAPVELNIASVLTLKADDKDGTNVFKAGETNGLNADLRTALVKNRTNAGVTYKLVNIINPIGVVKYDETTHKVTIDQIIDLQDGFPTVTVNIKVTYTYWFGTREVVVPVEIKPSSAKPVIL